LSPCFVYTARSSTQYVASLSAGLADLDIVAKQVLNADDGSGREGGHFYAYTRDRRLLIQVC
jgi:hypothetical protein